MGVDNQARKTAQLKTIDIEWLVGNKYFLNKVPAAYSAMCSSYGPLRKKS